MFSKAFFVKNIYWVAFVSVILIAIVLRFWQLGAIPAGFHGDEAAFGYNAYSILKTGKDEYGVSYPLVLKSFGDYKAAVYSYIAIPFIYIHGLNEWSVRAPSAIFGIAFVLLTYLFAYHLSHNRGFSLLAMVMAAFSSLGIFLSRVVSDPLVSVTFLYGAIYCWFQWVANRRFLYIVGIALLMFLSFYTNTVTRIFVVPFLFLMGIMYWKEFDRTVKWVFVGITIVITCSVLALYVNPAGARLSQISVFSTPDVQLPLNEEIREDGVEHVPVLVSRFFHNKISGYATYLLKNYTDYLSFQFLFQQATQPVREQVPGMGVLMLIECPFLLWGIFTVLHKKLKYGIFALLWFLLVPATICIASDEIPNIHRFFLALLPIHILVALGMVSAYNAVTKKYRVVVVFGISVLFLLNIFYFLHQLFVHQPTHNPIYRDSAFNDVALYLKDVYKNYDVVVSQKMLEDMLFYWPIDPATYQKAGSPRDTDNAWFRNIFFVTDACPSDLSNPKVFSMRTARILFIDKGECLLEKDDTVVKTIYYKNTAPAYYLVEKTIVQ
jgi:4-amino-4-deoxy-L-arabinose transferase-like glycosyltransferase